MNSYTTIVLWGEQDQDDTDDELWGSPIAASAPGDAVGVGGFSQVYRVTDAQTGRINARKRLVLKPHWNAAIREQARACFQREAQILAQLNHPQIPHFSAYDTDAGEITMDYIPGESLRDLMVRSGCPLSERQALDYARAVCEVLAYLHNASPTPIIHGDIKPSNLMIDDTGKLWVIDFGLAHQWDHQPDAVAELIMGTPGYTPPEQWRGAATPRSDVYALAATLYTLLTNQQISAEPNLESVVYRRHNVGNPAIEQLIREGLDPCEANRPVASAFLAALDRVCARS